MTDGPRILVDYQSISEVTGVSSADLKNWIPLIPELKRKLDSLSDVDQKVLNLKGDSSKAIKAVKDLLHGNESKASNERQELREDLTHLNKNARNERQRLRELESLNENARNERQGLREALISLNDELANVRITLMDQISRRSETNNNDDEGPGDNEVDDEPGIAMEDQLRIKEQSAKAIEIYTSTLLSTVWQGCSRGTYGDLCCLLNL
jgi:hypothetical protein